MILTVTLRDPANKLVLIEGVLFRASYLGSTQLTAQCGHTTKDARMIQAHEAVCRVKVPCLSAAVSVCVCACACVLC